MTEDERAWKQSQFPMNCSAQRNILNYIINRILHPLPFTLGLTSRLTFPAVFITDLISLLQALEDFIWMYALTLYCRKDNSS